MDASTTGNAARLVRLKHKSHGVISDTFKTSEDGGSANVGYANLSNPHDKSSKIMSREEREEQRKRDLSQMVAQDFFLLRDKILGLFACCQMIMNCTLFEGGGGRKAGDRLQEQMGFLSATWRDYTEINASVHETFARLMGETVVAVRAEAGKPTISRTGSMTSLASPAPTPVGVSSPAAMNTGGAGSTPPHAQQHLNQVAHRIQMLNAMTPTSQAGQAARTPIGGGNALGQSLGASFGNNSLGGSMHSLALSGINGMRPIVVNHPLPFRVVRPFKRLQFGLLQAAFQYKQDLLHPQNKERLQRRQSQVIDLSNLSNLSPLLDKKSQEVEHLLRELEASTPEDASGFVQELLDIIPSDVATSITGISQDDVDTKVREEMKEEKKFLERQEADRAKKRADERKKLEEEKENTRRESEGSTAGGGDASGGGGNAGGNAGGNGNGNIVGGSDAAASGSGDTLAIANTTNSADAPAIANNAANADTAANGGGGEAGDAAGVANAGGMDGDAPGEADTSAGVEGAHNSANIGMDSYGWDSNHNDGISAMNGMNNFNNAIGDVPNFELSSQTDHHNDMNRNSDNTNDTNSYDLTTNTNFNNHVADNLGSNNVGTNPYNNLEGSHQVSALKKRNFTRAPTGVNESGVWESQSDEEGGGPRVSGNKPRPTRVTTKTPTVLQFIATAHPTFFGCVVHSLLSKFVNAFFELKQALMDSQASLVDLQIQGRKLEDTLSENNLLKEQMLSMEQSCQDAQNAINDQRDEVDRLRAQIGGSGSGAESIENTNAVQPPTPIPDITQSAVPDASTALVPLPTELPPSAEQFLADLFFALKMKTLNRPIIDQFVLEGAADLIQRKWRKKQLWISLQSQIMSVVHGGLLNVNDEAEGMADNATVGSKTDGGLSSQASLALPPPPGSVSRTDYDFLQKILARLTQSLQAVLGRNVGGEKEEGESDNAKSSGPSALGEFASSFRLADSNYKKVMPAGQWIRWLTTEGNCFLVPAEARSLLRLFMAPGGFNRLSIMNIPPWVFGNKSNNSGAGRNPDGYPDGSPPRSPPPLNKAERQEQKLWEWEIRSHHIQQLEYTFFSEGNGRANRHLATTSSSNLGENSSLAIGLQSEEEFLKAYAIRHKLKQLPTNWEELISKCRLVCGAPEVPWKGARRGSSGMSNSGESGDAEESEDDSPKFPNTSGNVGGGRPHKDIVQYPVQEDFVKVILGWKLPLLPITVMSACNYWGKSLLIVDKGSRTVALGVGKKSGDGGEGNNVGLESWKVGFQDTGSTSGAGDISGGENQNTIVSNKNRITVPFSKFLSAPSGLVTWYDLNFDVSVTLKKKNNSGDKLLFKSQTLQHNTISKVLPTIKIMNVNSSKFVLHLTPKPGTNIWTKLLVSMRKLKFHYNTGSLTSAVSVNFKKQLRGSRDNTSVGDIVWVRRADIVGADTGGRNPDQWSKMEVSQTFDSSRDWQSPSGTSHSVIGRLKKAPESTTGASKAKSNKAGFNRAGAAGGDYFFSGFSHLHHQKLAEVGVKVIARFPHQLLNGPPFIALQPYFEDERVDRDEVQTLKNQFSATPSAPSSNPTDSQDVGTDVGIGGFDSLNTNDHKFEVLHQKDGSILIRCVPWSVLRKEQETGAVGAGATADSSDANNNLMMLNSSGTVSKRLGVVTPASMAEKMYQQQVSSPTFGGMGGLSPGGGLGGALAKPSKQKASIDNGAGGIIKIGVKPKEDGGSGPSCSYALSLELSGNPSGDQMKGGSNNADTNSSDNRLPQNIAGVFPIIQGGSSSSQSNSSLSSGGPNATLAPPSKTSWRKDPVFMRVQRLAQDGCVVDVKLNDGTQLLQQNILQTILKNNEVWAVIEKELSVVEDPKNTTFLALPPSDGEEDRMTTHVGLSGNTSDVKSAAPQTALVFEITDSDASASSTGEFQIRVRKMTKEQYNLSTSSSSKTNFSDSVQSQNEDLILLAIKNIKLNLHTSAIWEKAVVVPTALPSLEEALTRGTGTTSAALSPPTSPINRNSAISPPKLQIPPPINVSDPSVVNNNNGGATSRGTTTPTGAGSVPLPRGPGSFEPNDPGQRTPTMNTFSTPELPTTSPFDNNNNSKRGAASKYSVSKAGGGNKVAPEMNDGFGSPERGGGTPEDAPSDRKAANDRLKKYMVKKPGE